MGAATSRTQEYHDIHAGGRPASIQTVRSGARRCFRGLRASWQAQGIPEIFHVPDLGHFATFGASMHPVAPKVQIILEVQEYVTKAAATAGCRTCLLQCMRQEFRGMTFVRRDARCHRASGSAGYSECQRMGGHPTLAVGGCERQPARTHARAAGR